jgi:hypothetical protein
MPYISQPSRAGLDAHLPYEDEKIAEHGDVYEA